MPKSVSEFEHSDVDIDEEKWPALIRAGDDEVFERMFLAYAVRLRSFADGYLNSVETAEEVVQDVFLWLWNNRESWSPAVSVRTYLYGSVRNAALGVLRRRKLQDNWNIREISDRKAQGDLSISADEQLVHVELMERLKAAIASLTEKRRTVITLRWMQKMSYKEIAAVMESSPKAVEVQLYRALQDLKERLKDFE